MEELARTPYFSKALDRFLTQLIKATDQLRRELNHIPEEVCRRILARIWVATKYLAGSVTREIPYEIVYGLKLALDDWNPASPRTLALTTALLSDRNFYFQRIDVDAYTLIEAFLKIKFNEDLIQISFPRLYRHRPLQALALYHELGHFIDTNSQVTEYSLIRFPPDKYPQATPSIPPGISLPAATLEAVHRRHRQEMFADLFGASYAGSAYSVVLSDMAYDHPASPTHPATKFRIALISDYLSGKSSPVLAMFNEVLRERGMPELKIRYIEPDISSTFGNIRPHRIISDGEVHGILSSASKFWAGLETGTTPDAWRGLSRDEIGRVMNDLVERSIRNRMFEKVWAGGTSA